MTMENNLKQKNIKDNLKNRGMFTDKRIMLKMSIFPRLIYTSNAAISMKIPAEFRDGEGGD